MAILMLSLDDDSESTEDYAYRRSILPHLDRNKEAIFGNPYLAMECSNSYHESGRWGDLERLWTFL